jgi:hypothetical protein
VAGFYFGAFFMFVTLGEILIGGPSPSFNQSSSGNVPVEISGAVFIVAAFVVIFGWMDATIRVARRSDPLHRNTLRWTKLRYFVFIVSFFSLVGSIFSLVYNVGFPHGPPQSGSPSILTGFPLLAPIGFALLLGGIALLLSARRSKDAILQRHLKWFGIFIIFLFVTNEAENEILAHELLVSNSSLLQIVTFGLFIVAAYFLYRCARSLTPVNPYPLEVKVEEEGGGRPTNP